MIEIDEISEKAMFDFLQTHFPIKKLKDNKQGRRFRRGIIMDDTFTGYPTVNRFMSPIDERNRTYKMLFEVLKDVFGFPKDEINMVLLKYFNII